MKKSDTFAARLRAAQARARLSNNQLAAASGLARDTIQKLRAGNRSAPYPETVVALARALGCSTDELLGLGA